MVTFAQDRTGVLVELGEDECIRRLHCHAIGRVALSLGALPAIFPVNYAMLDGDIVFRTGPGTKLDAALRGTVVAFEVDEADVMSHTGWSVMVIGVARPISDPAELERAEQLPLMPWAERGRDTFVRLETRRVSGRELTHLAALHAEPALAAPSPR